MFGLFQGLESLVFEAWWFGTAGGAEFVFIVTVIVTKRRNPLTTCLQFLVGAPKSRLPSDVILRGAVKTYCVVKPLIDLLRRGGDWVLVSGH